MVAIQDELLTHTIDEMVRALTMNTYFSENIRAVEFALVSGVFFLGMGKSEENSYKIFLNRKIKRFIQTKRGLARAYAVIAHEIGHFIHHSSLEKIPTSYPGIFFLIKAEHCADKIALKMLEKIYPGEGKKILIEQANAALTQTKRSKLSLEQIKLTEIYANERISNLLAT